MRSNKKYYQQLIIAAFIIFPLTAAAAWYNLWSWFPDNPPAETQQIEGITALGAPVSTFHRNLLPITDSTYEIGTSTNEWKNLYVDRICLAGDCQTAWSAGGGEANTGSSLGTGVNLFDSKSGADLRFNTLSAGSNVSFSTTTNKNTIVISATGGGSGTYPFTALTIGGTETVPPHAPIYFARGLLAASSTLGQLIAGNIIATSSATSTFAGGINAAGLKSSNGLHVTGGSVLINDALQVEGAARFPGGISGDVVFDGSINFTADVQIDGAIIQFLFNSFCI